MPDALNNLTICITSFGRGNFLARTIESVRNAGVRRVAIAAVCADKTGREVIELQRRAGGWLSFDVNYVDRDIGCNNTWTLAAYLSRTERVLILHDDDVLLPAFGEVYEETIAPGLDDPSVGLATWRAHVLQDDGKIRPTDYEKGPTGVRPSIDLALRVCRMGELSLSPVIAIFDRTTVIQASKEAESTLTYDDCLERPGMLLGTEILVYLRHLEKTKRWLYVAEVLSLYGSHAGSGTVRAERELNGIARLARGYDKARIQGGRPQSGLKPKILLVTSKRASLGAADEARVAKAKISRAFLAGTFEIVELDILTSRLKRSLGEFPYIRDLFDLGVRHAMPEDVVAYVNDDIGLTIDAPARILNAIENSGGVAVCPRRNYPDAYPLVRSVKNCRTDGGIDLFAVTPDWWRANREEIPDMVIGRECWDTCFAIYAIETSKDYPEPKSISTMPTVPEMLRYNCVADDVCWHEPHFSAWQVLRKRDDRPGAHNRFLARKFFGARNNAPGLRAVAEPS